MGVVSCCGPVEVWLRANSLMDASMFRTPATIFCFKLAPILPRFSYSSRYKRYGFTRTKNLLMLTKMKSFTSFMVWHEVRGSRA